MSEPTEEQIAQLQAENRKKDFFSLMDAYFEHKKEEAAKTNPPPPKTERKPGGGGFLESLFGA